MERGDLAGLDAGGRMTTGKGSHGGTAETAGVDAEDGCVGLQGITSGGERSDGRLDPGVEHPFGWVLCGGSTERDIGCVGGARYRVRRRCAGKAWTRRGAR